jgi:hypothetical protein
MATRSNPPTLTLVDARRRVEGHWAALTLACRAVDEAQILEQIAAFQTLVDAGCLNVLDPADPMAVLALCHQLRRLRNQLVQHTARVKRASGTIALGGGCLISPSIALLAGFPWGLVGLGVGVVFLLLALFANANPYGLEECIKALDSLIARLQAFMEE